MLAVTTYVLLYVQNVYVVRYIDNLHMSGLKMKNVILIYVLSTVIVYLINRDSAQLRA